MMKELRWLAGLFSVLFLMVLLSYWSRKTLLLPTGGEKAMICAMWESNTARETSSDMDADTPSRRVDYHIQMTSELGESYTFVTNDDSLVEALTVGDMVVVIRHVRGYVMEILRR